MVKLIFIFLLLSNRIFTNDYDNLRNSFIENVKCYERKGMCFCCNTKLNGKCAKEHSAWFGIIECKKIKKDKKIDIYYQYE